MESIINDKIEKRTQRQNGEGSGDIERQKDLLDLMMDSRNEEGDSLNEVELADHTKTYLFY